MNQLIAKFVAELKAQQEAIAAGAMFQPREDLLKYGVMAGRYQGIQNALDTLDSILRDNAEQELKS